MEHRHVTGMDYLPLLPKYYLVLTTGIPDARSARRAPVTIG
jgi:hypothetical protein